jgi:predicted KAP-like P-loop ATPase
MAKESSAMWSTSADEPIEAVEQDRLSRKDFSRQLAKAIAGWTGHQSLTIALTGVWGSGKSSIKNMAVQALKELASEVEVIEFNPWRWGNQDQLAEAFFREIGLALGRDTNGNASESVELANKWRRYAATLKAGSDLTSGFQTVLTWALGATGAFSVLAALNWLPVVLRPYLGALGAFALVAAAVLSRSGKIAEAIANYFEEKGSAEQKTLEEAKDALAQSLQKRSSPIVVILDDVDRLTDAQVALLFQLVKANADFPKFVFVMLFQRDVVEKSLNTIAGNNGAEYLKKIVQVMLDIPLVDRSHIDSMLFEGLNAHLIGMPEEEFDRTRWGNLFVGGIQVYFKTVRDVKRYLASLQFYVSLFKNESGWEVDLIDLFAIEAIRVFSPAIYTRIGELKPILTSVGRPYGQKAQAEYKSTVNTLADGEPEHLKAPILDVVRELFPGTDWAFGGSEKPTEYLEIWLKERRISSPVIFDRFFQFGVPQNDISGEETDRVFSLAGDRNALLAALTDLNNRGMIFVFVQRLDAHKDEISLQVAVPFITAIFDIGDQLPEDDPGTFIGPSLLFRRVVFFYLRRQQDESERMSILRTAITETTGLIQPLMLTSSEIDPKRREEPEKNLVSDEDAQELKALCVKKIREAALEGPRLSKNAKLGSILYRWLDWTEDAAEVNKWVSNVASSPEGAMLILRALVSRGSRQSIDDKVGVVTWNLRLGDLERFVDLAKFQEQMEMLIVSNLDERDRNCLRAYQRAVKRRREGKGDDDWGRDDDE